MACYFYILQSEQDSIYYSGYTCSDLHERVAKHNRAHKGFTARKQAWKLVYCEKYTSQIEARNREKQVKAWKSRAAIENLIKSGSSGE